MQLNALSKLLNFCALMIGTLVYTNVTRQMEVNPARNCAPNLENFSPEKLVPYS